MKRQQRKKKNDNRGSTIIIVLVTMTFLTVLASVLLYLSLINLQMKKMDKAGKVNFYSAEAVMNEIRAGVQEAVSDAIKEAYTSVLISYNTTAEAEQANNFRNLFYNELFTNTLGSGALFLSDTEYDPGALKAFVTNLTGVEIRGSGAVEPVTDEAGSVMAVVMKAVSVNYIANGYETNVSSDIRIQAPQLPYTSTTSRQTAMPDFAVIAKGTLQQLEASGTVGIFGNVYAGGVTVSGGGNTFNVQNAPYFVSAGPVTVNGGAMTLNINSSLWARDIKLDAGGRMTVAGDAYIANDLNLYGNDTQVVLSGRYYGYGDSTTNPNESSSIIINGKNTVLDMSTLRALLLAGHSFVNFGTTNGYVMMGESVSVKSNQVAYLVPDSCLGQIDGKPISNPYEYTGIAPDQAVLENTVNLGQKIIGEKTLSDYGIRSTANNIQYIRKSVGSTNLIYFCLKFTNIRMPDDSTKSASSWANEYFKDYYNANGPMIQKYVNIYSNGIVMAANLTKNLNGEAFTFDGSTLSPIIDANGAPAASISEISSSYANLCVTLSRTESVTGIPSAYDYFINQDDINALTGTITYPEEDTDKKAVVVKGNYTLNADTDASIHIVIASGNVTVSRDYTGLILAGGNVTIQSDAVITASRGAVADALQSLLSEDKSHYKYLNPLVVSPMNISNNSHGSAGVWDMHNIVTYENWKKNAI